MTKHVKQISLSEIFDPNSQYIQDLAAEFERQYGDELDIILDLSEKYNAAFADIDPSELDADDLARYQRVLARN